MATIEDRIRMMRSESASAPGVSQNDAMTTWEPTGEVIPISEYNRRQQAFGRATKEARIGGGADDEPVQSPQGQVPWWVAQERRQGVLTSPVPLSKTLPAPGAALAGQQKAGRAQKGRPLPTAPKGVEWKDMGNYTVWEPTGEVITIDEYNSRQVAAGRATKEGWLVSADPHELEDTPHGRVPKWLRYERATGAHTSPVRLTDVLPAPGAAAAAEQRRAAAGKPAPAKRDAAPEGNQPAVANPAGGRPKARMMGKDDQPKEPVLDRNQMIEVRAGVLAQNGLDLPLLGVPPNLPTDEHRKAAERELVDRGDIPPAAANVEQGVLPGEEQVTTLDTFSMLPPDVRLNLKKSHLNGGHADTMDFGDWLSENFGDLPPQQRAKAMRDVASRPPAQMVVAGAKPAPRPDAPAPAQQAAPRQVTPEQQARIDARRQEQHAREVGNRYAGMLTPEEEQAIDWAATAPGGREFLRRLNADLQRRYQRDRHAQVRDRATNYNLSQDLRSPNYAPGMGVRSLIDAVRSGNSEMAGAVYDIYGNPIAGGQSRALAGVRTRAAADERAAQIEADNAYRTAQVRAGGGDGEDPLKMEILQRELDTALANPDPVRRHQAVSLVVKMSSGETDPAVIEAETKRIIASHFAQSGTPEGREYAMKHLQSLVANRDEFIAFAVYSLGIDADVAAMMHEDATKGRSWTDAGRDAGRGAVQGVRAVGGAVRGLGSGIAEGVREGFSGR